MLMLTRLDPIATCFYQCSVAAAQFQYKIYFVKNQWLSLSFHFQSLVFHIISVLLVEATGMLGKLVVLVVLASVGANMAGVL